MTIDYVPIRPSYNVAVTSGHVNRLLTKLRTAKGPVQTFVSPDSNRKGDKRPCCNKPEKSTLSANKEVLAEMSPKGTIEKSLN